MGEAFEREFITQCLDDAQRGLDLIAECAAHSHWSQVREHAHAIKGVAGNVGLVKFASQAGDLMKLADWQFAAEWRRRVAALRDQLREGREALEARLKGERRESPANRTDQP
jgi:two-component system sensor histidine kinase RpfC